MFCPGGRLVFQRSWGGSESEEPAERNLASVSCHRWLLSESARISLCVDDLREAVTTLEAVAKSWKRVYGELHPETRNVQSALATARHKLARAAAGVRVQVRAVN